MVRRPYWIIGLFCFLLMVSTAVSFVGYHYLFLMNQYNTRNFQHLSAVERALDKLRGSPIPRQDSIAIVRENVILAKAQAEWCTDNLMGFEQRLFGMLGASEALAICRADVEIATATLALLEKLEHANANNLSGPGGPFAIGLSVADHIERMIDDSLRFNPYILLVKQKLFPIIRSGTLIASLSLLVVMAFASLELIKLWRQRVESETHLADLSGRFKHAIEATSDGFALFDKDLYLLACNEEYKRLAAHSPGNIQVGMHVRDIVKQALHTGFYPRIKASDHKALLDSILNRVEYSESDVQMEIADDRFVQVKVRPTDMGDVAVTRTDVTEFVRNHRRQEEYALGLKKAKDEVEFISLHDPLTGLANRRYLDEALTAGLQLGPTALIKIDLDRFKQVNDVLGHHAGDYVLKHVGEVLTTKSRKCDLVARIGGDEFVVLCEPGTGEKEARVLGQRLLEAILEPVLYEGRPCYFGASLGIAISNEDTKDPGSLLSFADAALYEAKSSGRGQLQFFDTEIECRIKTDRRLAEDLDRAFKRCEILPFYQTQHDAKTYDIVGVEVLVRWQHPELGLLKPDQFLPLVRQLGMEACLDAKVFDQAMVDFDAMTNAGVVIPKIGFNVSAGRLLAPEFLSKAKAHGFRDDRRIAFELLESVSVENHGERLMTSLKALRELGFELEIDDFGSEHASITSIFQLWPNSLKIDRGIIKPMVVDIRNRRLVRTIIEMGKDLNISVIAEGVETQQHAEILARLDCDVLQGFYFSEPMSRDDLIVFCNTKRPKFAVG